MKNFVLYIFVLMGLFSCEKLPLDYRNKYLGNYDFTRRDSYYAYPNYVDKTYAKVFKGSVKKGDLENELIIHFDNYVNSSGYTIENIETFNVDYEGNILEGNVLRGEFYSTKKIELVFPVPGLGRVGNIIYTGVRK